MANKPSCSAYSRWPLVFGKTADDELEIAYTSGLLEYLMSPASCDAQSPGEVVRNYRPAGKQDRRELEPEPVLTSWLAQILLD
jgi:hypothetical protein